MIDQRIPAHETTKLERLAATQKWLFLSAQCTVALALVAIASRRVLGEGYEVLLLLVGIGLLLGAIGIFVYLTCFQRCPRCAGWIVMPKCPGCGLGLGGARESA